MKIEANSSLIYQFYECCHNGKLEQLKQMLCNNDEQFREMIKTPFLKCPLMMATNNDHFEVVQYLMTSSNKMFDFTFKINNSLKIASKKGYIDIVKFLLTHKSLKLSTINVDELLQSALYNNHWQTAEFLISSDQLEKKAQPYLCFICACRDGKLNVVKFLTSEKVCALLDIYAKNNAALRACVINNSTEVTKYLINEYSMNINQYMETFLNNYTNESSRIVMNKILSNNLNNKDKKTKIVKV